MKSNLIIPKTQGIKYAGSKLKIIPYMFECLKDIRFEKVLDGFSGTTRVAQAFAQTGKSVTSNDTAIWSEVFGRCYLKADKPDSFYQNIFDKLNSLNGKIGWFSEKYGGTELEKKKPFQLHNMMKLDAIRPEIEQLSLDWADKCVVLASLILALDNVDSTLGHFSSYLAKWSSRSYKTMKMELPRRFETDKTRHEVLCEDVFDVIKNRSFDLAYFDPPYGSNNDKMPSSRVRYNAYYHFWKTVILNDKPALFGKAGRREDSRDKTASSVFESFEKDEGGKFFSAVAIDKLIREVQSDYVLLSYGSSGRTSKTDLMDSLTSNGTIEKMVEIDYKKNVMASMKWTNEWTKTDSGNQEYLFVLKK